VTSAHDPGAPAATPLKVLLLAGVLVWAVLTVAPELGTFLPRNKAEQAVALVVQRAAVASQSAAIPRSRDSTGAVSAEELAAMHAQVDTVADDLFTGAYHDSWTHQMYEVVDLADAEFIFSGGADDFSRWHIEIHGSQAEVQVRARIFLEMAQTLLGHRTVAENMVDYDIRLTKIDGSWFVASMGHRFAPGGGP
jgi:hypothetical protein